MSKSKENPVVMIRAGNSMVEAREIDIVSSDEKFNSYLLSDGTLFKQKNVLTKVYRLEHKYSDIGEPIYISVSTNVSTAKVPEELRQ